MAIDPAAADRPITRAEHLQRIVARAFGKLPGSILVRLSGRPPVVIDGQTLDPHVQWVLSMRKKRGHKGLVEPTPQLGRARFRHECRVMGMPVTDVAAVRDFDIPGPAGPLRVRHYAPSPAEDDPQPITIYLHGGGFTIGDLDTHDEPCRILCREGRMHVLSVDYRLAPEHPFPAAADDTMAAFRWAQAHAAELGADPARVAIGGDSAGGNLTAVISIEARDDRPPVAQLLIYPATDSETRRPSEEKFSDGYFLSMADRVGFSRCYTAGTGHTGMEWRVSPLRAPDLGGVPPALVATAGFDILRDEGDEYAEALKAAGTRTEHLCFPSLGHGFIHMTTITPAARAAMVRIAQSWRALLNSTGG